MLAQELIRRKRDGAALDPGEIAAFMTGLADGRVTESQAAAWAMAVFFRGMSRAETVALTRAMRDSGTVLDWRALGVEGPTVDKHSTGGVGDKVSLILAPLLAACGAYVPMISGRGLGHTGGTLDKMDAIPGYRSQPPRDDFARAVRETGFAIVGATGDLAPADRRLYAIRDVTATVESLPLITASILSKKLAGGVGALVLDVKSGSGAFMATDAEARTLAESLVAVATGAGVPAVALLTDMNQPLGRHTGNAVEVREAIGVLSGRDPADPRLLEVTLALAAEALVLGGLCVGMEAARALAEARLADGSAADRFARGVAALGGPADLLQRPGRHLPAAPHIVPVPSGRDGHVTSFDTRAVGVGVIALGGGRTRPQDGVDHRVGFTDVAGIGQRVARGEPLAFVHAADPAAAEAAVLRLRAAITLGDDPPAPLALVRGRIG